MRALLRVTMGRDNCKNFLELHLNRDKNMSIVDYHKADRNSHCLFASYILLS